MAWWIFQNVVVTAALALVVAMVCRVGLFRIGPVARHALWLLVLVKFVTPPLVVWPWAVPDPLGVSAFDMRAGEPGTATASLPPSIERAPVTEAVEVPVPTDRTFGVTSDAPGQPQAAHVTAVAWPWFFGTWAAGSLILLGIESVRLARLIQRVRMAGPVDPAIEVRVAELSARMGLAPVRVVSMAGTASPAIWCFGRTRLLWPADLPADSSEACIDGLLVHELAHVKRRDHLVGWIELVAGIIWWWNPLFWFVRSSLREQAELACDAWVISALPNGRRAYAESLLTLSGAAVRGAPSMALLGIRATSRRVLERRLVMIMKGRAPLRLPWVGLVSLALVAAMTLPAWATSSQQIPPPPPPPAAVRPAPTPPPPPPTAPTPATAPTPPTPAPAQGTSPKIAPAAPMKTTPAMPAKNAQTPTPAAPAVAGRPQAMPPPPAPATAATRQRRQAPTAWNNFAFAGQEKALPADGQELVKGFDAQREAIQKEVDQKIAANRAAVIKALEDLQDKYTKAGKLDEAIAIRDYLRAGGPGGYWYAPNGQAGWVIRR